MSKILIIGGEKGTGKSRLSRFIYEGHNEQQRFRVNGRRLRGSDASLYSIAMDVIEIATPLLKYGFIDDVCKFKHIIDWMPLFRDEIEISRRLPLYRISPVWVVVADFVVTEGMKVELDKAMPGQWNVVNLVNHDMNGINLV